jgi:UPF0755 protein
MTAFKKMVVPAFWLLVVLAILVAGAISLGAAYWRSPAAAEVEIAPGSTVRTIAVSLGESRVIGMPKLFEVWARLKGLNRRLRAGTYAFPAGMTMAEVMDKIARGEVKQYEFRVIEGATLAEITAALAGQPFLSDPAMPETFARLAGDAAFIAGLKLKGMTSLEGYLFPDTYLVMRPTAAVVLIKRMVGRFREVWEMLAPPGTPLPHSQQEIVTLASLIEKEAGNDAERPIIAGVFENRLKAGIPLASDPTIIYGLPNFDGNIRKQDITNPHPYNTYVHKGLPPGPICNPGRASLAAALHPAETDFLYFVAKGDGTHQFSKTMAEHVLAVRQYQIEPAKNR